MIKSKKTVLTLFLMAFAFIGLATSAYSSTSPFAQHDTVKSTTAIKGAKGKCGEGKCGNSKSEKSTTQASAETTTEVATDATSEKKCGEGKCGDNKVEKKAEKKKCGEGKCG